MTHYIPGPDTYYAADSGPGLLALILIGLAIVVGGYVLVGLFVEQISASIAASDREDELVEAFAAALDDTLAVDAAMRAGADAR